MDCFTPPALLQEGKMQNLYLESALLSLAETIRNEKEKWTVLHHPLSSMRVRPMVDSSTNWRCCFWGGKCEVTWVVFPSWHCFLHCSGYSNMHLNTGNVWLENFGVLFTVMLCICKLISGSPTQFKLWIKIYETIWCLMLTWNHFGISRHPFWMT